MNQDPPARPATTPTSAALAASPADDSTTAPGADTPTSSAGPKPEQQPAPAAEPEPTAEQPPEESPGARMFFAWHLGPVGLEQMAEWQQRLGKQRQLSDGVRWLTPEQLHVTLLFLGDVDPELIPELAQRVQAALADLPPSPQLQLDRLAFFPRRSRPRVLALAGSASEELKQWHRVVRQAVLELVPAVERPLPLKPHVTLARVTAHKATGAKLPRVRQPLNWPAGPLALMESRLEPGGAVYTTHWTQQPGDRPTEG